MTGRPRLRALTAAGLAGITGVEIDGVLYDVRLTPRTPPEPDPEPVPNLVRIGSATWPLAAVNPVRGPGRDYEAGRATNELVFYTAPTTVTETNIHGWEVPVGPDGRVAGPGQVNRTPVPPDGGVLSGHHGPRQPRAGEWLKTHAVPGALVELIHEETEPPAGTLPGWVTAAYWQQYEGPGVSTIIAEAPQYNLLFAAFATGSGKQSMTFRPYVQDDTSFTRQMRESQDRGVLWSLSIGGGVKTEESTVIRTEAEARECFRTLKPIIDRYRFQGIDDDLENGPGGFTEVGLTSLFRMLRDTYGPEFLLSSTPRPYEAWRVQIAGRLYQQGLLQILGWQAYDAPEYKDATYLRERLIKEIDTAQGAGVPYSAQVVGCITRTTYAYGWNTIDVYGRIVSELKATRGIRGAFIWHTGYDQKEGWSFARKISSLSAS